MSDDARFGFAFIVLGESAVLAWIALWTILSATVTISLFATLALMFFLFGMFLVLDVVYYLVMSK